MERIEQIIASLRQQVQTNPLMRDIVELIVAIGEQVLASNDSPAERVTDAAPSHVGKKEVPDTSADERAERHDRKQQEQAEEQYSPPSAEDLERLVEHFRSGRAYQIHASQSRRNEIEHEQERPEFLRGRDRATAVGGRDDTTAEPLYDVELVATRARLKAEVARWCADRLRGEIPYEAETRYYRSAVGRAKALPQCYLWMLEYRGPASLLEYVADCYDAIADVAELLPLVPRAQRRPRWAEELLDVAAAIQSALHHVLREAGLDVRRYPDPDQDAVFTWLKWYTRTFQKFIQRHMELRDPADFTRIQRWVEELDRLREEMPVAADPLNDLPAGDRRDNATEPVARMQLATLQAKQHLRTLRYHVGHILRGSIDQEHHWRRIREEIETIVELGVPPSNIELRSILLPIVDDMPTDDTYLTQPVRLVLREIDRYITRQEILQPTEQEPPQPSEEVRYVRPVLEGKTIVLIGGDERPHMRRAIEEAFGLRELIWVATRPHESLELFVPYIKRDDVALVLLAIRWSSHSYAEIADLCKRYGKPFVRLPGGYNPNQIAAQIAMQAANALGLEAPAAGLEPATL